MCQKQENILTEFYCLIYKFEFSVPLFDYIKNGQEIQFLQFFNYRNTYT